MIDIIDREQARKMIKEQRKETGVIRDYQKETMKQWVLTETPDWLQELVSCYIRKAIENGKETCLIPIQGYGNAKSIHTLAWALGYVANIYFFADFCVAENKRETKRRQKRIYKVVIQWR